MHCSLNMLSYLTVPAKEQGINIFTAFSLSDRIQQHHGHETDSSQPPFPGAQGHRSVSVLPRELSLLHNLTDKLPNKKRKKKKQL